jgi:TRAP-type transport system small permease protein
VTTGAARQRRLGRLRSALAEPPGWWSRAVRALTAIEIGIGVAALLVIFVLVLLQAGQRHLPFDGWSSTGELARFSLVWLTFVVAGVLVTKDSHISLEMADLVPSRPVRRWVRVFSCLVVAAVGMGMSAAAWSLVETQGILRSPSMGMPMSWFYAIVLVGLVSTVIRALVAALRYAVLGVPEDHHDHEAVPTA